MRNTKHNNFKIYDFRQEYKNSPDKVNHIVATDLTVEKTIIKLAEAGIDINELKPFVIMPLSCREAFDASFRNDKKYEQRQSRNGELFGYEDGLFERFHREYADEIDYLEELFRYEMEKRREEMKRLETAMEHLTEVQKRRIKMYYFDCLNLEQIARRENRNRKTIKESIRLALKKIQNFF